MGEKFDVKERWPDLFEELDDIQSKAVLTSLEAAWHEHWTPERHDVENLTSLVRSAVDQSAFRQRMDAFNARLR